MTVTCPADRSPLLAASLRQVRLTLQLREEAGFFGSAGSVVQAMTCPACGLTLLYAVPPLRPEGAGEGAADDL